MSHRTTNVNFNSQRIADDFEVFRGHCLQWCVRIIWFRRCRYMTVIRQTTSNCDSPINSIAVRPSVVISRAREQQFNRSLIAGEASLLICIQFIKNRKKQTNIQTSQNIDRSVDSTTAAHWILIAIFNRNIRTKLQKQARKIFARSVEQVARVSSVHLLPTKFISI